MAKILFCAVPFMVLLLGPVGVLRLCRVRGKALWIVFALSVAVTLYGVVNGLRMPRVREVVLEYSHLPASLEGYRIVQLSDLHVSTLARRGRIEEIVKTANALQPNLICVTGDLVDGEIEARARDLEPIRELAAADGVYYVNGNHEFYWSRPDWKALFDEWGLAFLANSSVSPREHLVVGGVNDTAAEIWGEEMPIAGKVFAPVKRGEFRILLEHRPRHAADNLAAFEVDLQLSGHTHGGIMPIADRLVAKLNGGFVRGLYPIGKGYLYVSPGTGQWAGFPVRLFNPSEITLFTLRSVL